MNRLNNPLTPPSILSAPSDHLQSAEKFQGIPGVECTASGNIYACWYGGGDGEGPDNFVMIARKNSQNPCWEAPEFVILHSGDNIRCFDPCLWIDPEKRLWCFWAQSFSPEINTISDGVNGVWGTVCDNPDDDSPIWAPPRRLCDGIMLNKPIVTRNGKWLFPVSIWGDGIGKGKISDQLRKFAGPNIYCSTDGGETLSYRGICYLPGGEIFDEHQLVELRDGRIWCMIRKTYGIGEGFSNDGGKSWSNCAPALLENPNSRFAIRRLQSGNLLLVNHQCREKESGEWRVREKLTAYLSTDDGASWSKGTLLDAREEVSYPDITEAPDGTILCIYDRRRYHEGEILLHHFSESELAAPVIPRQPEIVSSLQTK
jgi:hypothetical protein